MIHRYFPGSRTSSFLFHKYTINQVRHSSGISPSFIQVFNKHLTQTRSAITTISTRTLSIPETTTPTCHCNMSQLYVTVTCLCYLSLLPFTVTCHCYMSLLPVTVICNCYLSMLHVSVSCHCYLSM